MTAVTRSSAKLGPSRLYVKPKEGALNRLLDADAAQGQVLRSHHGMTSMKLLWFRPTSYTELPEDFRDKHPSARAPLSPFQPMVLAAK